MYSWISISRCAKFASSWKHCILLLNRNQGFDIGKWNQYICILMKKGLHLLNLLVSVIFVVSRKLWPLFLGLVLFLVLNLESGITLVCTTFALSQLIFKRRLARLFKSKCSDRGAFRFEKFIRIGNVVQPNILEHLIRPNSHHLFQLQFFWWDSWQPYPTQRDKTTKTKKQ